MHILELGLEFGLLLRRQRQKRSSTGSTSVLLQIRQINIQCGITRSEVAGQQGVRHSAKELQMGVLAGHGRVLYWVYPGFATRFEQISEGDVGC